MTVVKVERIYRVGKNRPFAGFRLAAYVEKSGAWPNEWVAIITAEDDVDTGDMFTVVEARGDTRAGAILWAKAEVQRLTEDVRRYKVKLD